MRKAAILCTTIAIALTLSLETAEAKSKAQTKREKIDAAAKDALNVVLTNRAKAKQLYDKAYGYAVFDNLKISLIISGGGGRGVAVDKSSGKRTYMNMGTGGLNIGLGAQKYQVVFLFEDKATFDDFVNKGWQAEANANAVAGNKGLNAESSAGAAGANVEAVFENGMALYQITDAGLMLQADIAGTKFWKNKKLNNNK